MNSLPFATPADVGLCPLRAQRLLDRLQADTARTKRFGFTGKLCIHPSQIGVVHAGLAPTDAEMAWARRVVDASHRAQGGAVQLDGAMVDTPVLLKARQMLTLNGRSA